MKRVNTGVIAAAGKGTRSYPRTTFIPKPLFRIDGKSILEKNIELLARKIKVKQIFVIVGHLAEQVMAEVERIRPLYPAVKIETSFWTRKGLASDVASLEGKFEGPFVTVLGDELYHESNHEKMLTTLRKHPGLAASVAVKETPLVSHIKKNYSVELDKDRVQHLVEKPENPANRLLGLGTYLFTQAFFDTFRNTPPSERTGVIEITEVIDRMARETREVYATMVQCGYFNINSLQDYHHAVYEIRNERFHKFKKSLIIPAANREQSIDDVLNDFKDSVDEIIVVDAGSEDRTREIASQHGAQVVPFNGPRKKEGAMVMAGLEAARGDICIVVSADGTFRCKDLPKLLEYMKDCDMAIGTRTTRQMIEQGANLKTIRRIMNLLGGKMIEVFYWGMEPRFTDASCRYFCVWKDTFLKIRPRLQEDGSLYIAEMMTEIVRSLYRCIEVPVTYFKPVKDQAAGDIRSIGDLMRLTGMLLKKKFGKIH
ncbi:MAG TPA: sugar pyrophosphorylase [Leptospiraceae bacterium]|nr:sugar pyrophosphorylase [Spirochaetaceae bacterium]HBS05481.1 sugar pyrophosphorylase [Leptospiraceae bacterium]